MVMVIRDGNKAMDDDQIKVVCWPADFCWGADMTLPGGRGTPTPGPPYRCTLHLDHHHQHHQHHHHHHNHKHHKHRHKHHHHIKDDTTIYLLGGRAACPPSSIHGRLQDRFAPHDIPPLSFFSIANRFLVHCFIILDSMFKYYVHVQ